MKGTSNKVMDGDRQRCMACGHPRKEHRGGGGCTVPKCDCASHEARETSS